MAALSIIICSRTGRRDEIFYGNIKDTVGCDHEIIVIDNSRNELSIFQAYNKGIGKSKGNIICFIHEDIIIHTSNWGNILKNLFKEHPETGLIGVAGTRVKTKMPSGWWDCAQTLRAVNIIQHLQNGTIENWEYGFENGAHTGVVAIDGVFMSMKKDERIMFNEELKGYHNYDLNLSLEHLKYGKSILVTNQILIEHFSEGKLDHSWYKSTYDFHRFYKNSLPAVLPGVINKKWTRALELNNGKYFIEGLVKHNFKQEAFILWLQWVRLNPLSKFHFRFFKLMLQFNQL